MSKRKQRFGERRFRITASNVIGTKGHEFSVDADETQDEIERVARELVLDNVDFAFEEVTEDKPCT